MLILQFDHFLNESEFEDYALQEIRTRWNSHVVAISANTHILKVVLPKESEVPYGRDTKADQWSVLGGTWNGQNLLKLLKNWTNAQDYDEE